MGDSKADTEEAGHENPESRFTNGHVIVALVDGVGVFLWYIRVQLSRKL